MRRCTRCWLPCTPRPRKLISRGVHIHPSVAELLPTVLQDLKLTQSAAWRPVTPRGSNDRVLGQDPSSLRLLSGVRAENNVSAPADAAPVASPRAVNADREPPTGLDRRIPQLKARLLEKGGFPWQGYLIPVSRSTALTPRS